MDWIRRHFVTLAVLAAIALSFVVSRSEADRSATEARIDNVAACVRSDSRTALFSAYQRRTSVSRRATGDIAVANDYAAFSHGSAAYLAIADYTANPQRATRTREVTINGTDARILTKHSADLVVQGCARAFHGGEEVISNLPPTIDPARPID
jgi:hypothetical protein